MDPPSAAALSQSRIDRFIAEVRKTMSEQDLDFFYRLLARIGQEQEIEMMDIAAALAFLNQRDRPLNVKEDPPRPPRRDRFDERPGARAKIAGTRPRSASGWRPRGAPPAPRGR